MGIKIEIVLCNKQGRERLLYISVYNRKKGKLKLNCSNSDSIWQITDFSELFCQVKFSSRIIPYRLFSHLLIRRYNKNLSCPSGSRFTDRLRAIFLIRHVPSGCTLTAVISTEICSTWMFMMTLSCNFENLIQHTLLGPSIHSHMNCVLVAELLRQSTPFATMFRNIQNHIDHLRIRYRDLTFLFWK